MLRPALALIGLVPLVALAAVPGTPTASTPATWSTDGTPNLTGGGYTDVDADPQVGAQFQIRPTSGVYGGAGAFDSGVIGAVRQWTTPALVNGTAYSWRCRYSDASGFSAFSAEQTFTVDTELPTAPSTPTISGGAPTAGFFTLDWTASVDNISGLKRYRVNVKENATNYIAANVNAPALTLNLI